MKVYAKVRKNGEYHSQNIAHAVFGFREMGAEIVKYEVIDEIYDAVTVEDIVLDYIDQVQTILDKFHIKPVCENYPAALRPFMGRRIWTDYIDAINANPKKWGVFVKPVRDKAFTGKVINGPRDLIDRVAAAFCTIPNRPMGCSIDFAVTVKDGKQQTIFLEMNDGYALGNYGLYHLSYAKLISARWSQLLGREDVFDFRKFLG